jgi:poly-gamma-glutamate biosynthesis protein PgsC/CapC
MIVASFAIGIIIGFIFFEVTGLTAGGIIVPGYLALHINEPERIIVTIMVSLVSYFLVRILARYVIIFGRRRFFMMILAGFLIRFLFDHFHVITAEMGIELQAIGYIIPGLIANEFYRQGIIKTILSMIIVVSIVGLFLFLLYP